MDREITINNTKILPGERKLISLKVARLPSRTNIEIPIYVHRAKEEGPVLLLMAGMHGDEVNGVEIIRRLLAEEQLNPRRGTIIAIPILNIYGFLTFSRAMPDGKDLNRSFPGSKRGSLASRMAHTFMEEIFPHIDCGIDFHTGGASRCNYPQIRCNLARETNCRLAEAFSPPLIVNADFREKSFRKMASKEKKNILVFEGGESLRFDQKAIEVGIAGALRVMKYLEMKEEAPESEFDPIWLHHTSWIRARNSGLFRATVPNGSQVKKKEALATITDPYGDFETVVRAPFNGSIIAVNHMPVVHAGDALIHLGREGSA